MPEIVPEAQKAALVPEVEKQLRALRAPAIEVESPQPDISVAALNRGDRATSVTIGNRRYRFENQTGVNITELKVTGDKIRIGVEDELFARDDRVELKVVPGETKTYEQVPEKLGLWERLSSAFGSGNDLSQGAAAVKRAVGEHFTDYQEFDRKYRLVALEKENRLVLAPREHAREIETDYASRVEGERVAARALVPESALEDFVVEKLRKRPPSSNVFVVERASDELWIRVDKLMGGDYSYPIWNKRSREEFLAHRKEDFTSEFNQKFPSEREVVSHMLAGDAFSSRDIEPSDY